MVVAAEGGEGAVAQGALPIRLVVRLPHDRRLRACEREERREERGIMALGQSFLLQKHERSGLPGLARVPSHVSTMQYSLVAQ